MLRNMLRNSLRCPLLAVALLVPGTLPAAQGLPSPAVAAQPCSDHEESFPSCGISRADKQKSAALYRQAVKLARRTQFEQALEKLHAALAISPRDTLYATAEQAVREKVAATQVRLGDLAMQQGDATAALSAFRRALELDPANSYASQRLQDALPPAPAAGAPSAYPPAPAAGAPSAYPAPPGAAQAALQAAMGEVRVTPAPGTQSFEFRGSSSAVLEKFAGLFGIATVSEEGLTSRNVRIKLDDVDWETGSQILQKTCKILIIPISGRQVLLANDSEENRKALTRMSLRTFYAQGGSTPQQLTDLTTALRVLFDLRFITPNPAKGTIVIRAPQPTLDAVARFLDDLQNDQPSVMLEIKIFEVSTAFTKDLGTSVPNQFTVFNVPSEIRKLVSSSSFQQILAALNGSGQSVNAGTILAALLASASSSSPLTQPFATFGGGMALSAVTLPPTSLHFSGVNSLARTVDDVLLRSEHGSAATLKVGERYPIVSTQFKAVTPASSLLSSLGISTAATSTTSAAVPSPQFYYEDLGLVLKATPQVHGNLVSLVYELTLRALGPYQPNGLPLVTNREMKGSINAEDGQPVVIAGLMDQGEMASLNGIPLLSGIPVLGKAFTAQTNEKTADELLIVVTPHLTSARLAHGIYLPIPMNVPK
jgi:general secretion pathway protein D